MNPPTEILVVNNEPRTKNLINKELETAGYRTVLAQNEEEALVALWERQHIGLVLFDVRLPVINGLSILRIIRKLFPDKKIIASSALQKDEHKFLVNDVDDYFDKSEDLENLIKKIDHVLAKNLRSSDKI